MRQDTDPVIEDVNEEDTIEEFEKRLQVSHNLFVKIAKRMVQGETCLALIAKDLYNEMLAEDEVCKNDIKLPDEQIIADAKAITHVGKLLHDNYSKEHDHAVKVLGEIMSRHAPNLQKVWSEYVKIQNSK